MTEIKYAVADSDETFWSEIFRLHESVTPLVAKRVLFFTLLALVIDVLNIWLPLGIDLAAYGVAGAVLGFLLVFRTNAGYDRWYEARKMWGQIINQSRNLAITVLAHGPDDGPWCDSIVRWICAFSHVTRALLRNENVPPEVYELLGKDAAEAIQHGGHAPSYVALQIGEMLRHAVDKMGMDAFGFLAADRERALLIEYAGSCERIRNTPIPQAYSINIRRLAFMYLIVIPFGLLANLVNYEWLVPPVMALIAYAILAMDQIGVELSHPFVRDSLNHLPLEQFTTRIQTDLMALVRIDAARLRQRQGLPKDESFT